MSKKVKTVFAEATQHLTFDKELARKIKLFVLYFVNKNSEHISFFGGNLLGVETVRFKEEDNNRWFDDVLDVDEFLLKDELHALDSINSEWKVSSNVFYLSCVGLLNKLYNTPLLSTKEKEDAMVDTMLVMQYKMITSILFNMFRYPADRGVAVATYAALSKKFSLKQYGTWNKLLEARARDVISHNSIHFKTIKDMDDDKAIIYLLSDVQTRIKHIIVVMRGVFETVLQTKSKIVTTSAIGMDMEGKSFIKDKARNINIYKRYLHETIIDKNNFVKLELIGIIGKVMYTMSEKFLEDTLNYMCDNYQGHNSEVIDEIIDETLLFTFNYMATNKQFNIDQNDLAGLIVKLKAVYMSSRSSDVNLLKIRRNLESLVKKAIKSKNDTVVSSVRTGVMLYLILRAFTMKHYLK